jgi:AraC-type transcriptional regulator
MNLTVRRQSIVSITRNAFSIERKKMDATTQQEQNAAAEQKISEKSTTLVSWARVIRQTLIKLDIDPEPLFEQANIDIALLEHSDARIPVEKMTALWHLAGSASQLPDFGLHVARQVTPATFHALGIAAMASDNAADAISRMIRYAPSMTDGIVIRLDASDGHFYLIFELQEGYQKFADACFEAVLGAIMHFGRAYIQLDIAPDAIHFQHEL